MTSRPAAAQHLRDLARLRRVRDRIDREYAQPLDVEALARGAHISAWRNRSLDRSGIERRRSRAAPNLTAMDITIHASFLPHNDPDASLAFCRDTLGFEVRNDVGHREMRWITVGPAEQPGTSMSGLPVRL